MTKEMTAYEALGGEEVLRQLTKRFYEIMDTLPEAKGIRVCGCGISLSRSESPSAISG